MTCRGYDAKAVKVSKSVKRVAASYQNRHDRGAFIKSFVRILEDEARKGGRKEK